VVDDPLLRERALPDGLTAGLWLESQELRLGVRSAPNERNPAAPQIVVMASGDLVPFEIVLRRDGTQEERRVAGTVEGAIQVRDPMQVTVADCRRAAGFTLIEVLAALVIVALGMLGVIEAVTQTARNGNLHARKDPGPLDRHERDHRAAAAARAARGRRNLG